MTNGLRVVSVIPHPGIRLLPTASGVTVHAEANPVRQFSEDTEKMARRRFQNPEPHRVGKWWSLLIWQDEFVAGKQARKRKRVPLAPATMPEREAKKIAAEYVRPLNQGLAPVAAAVTFEGYVEGTGQRIRLGYTRQRGERTSD